MRLLSWWIDFQYLLDRFPRDIKLSPSQPTIDAFPFHNSICKEFPYDLGIDVPTWVQQLCLCPCPFFEYFRNESVFKGLHCYNPFHDDRGPFWRSLCRPCLPQCFENSPNQCVDASMTSLRLIA